MKKIKMIQNQLMSLHGKIYYTDTKIDQFICLSLICTSIPHNVFLMIKSYIHNFSDSK